MKVVFDEGVPEDLETYLVGHEVSTVKREGWRGISNGKLLNLIENAGFEVFVTNDKRMEREQQLYTLPFAIVLLSTNHWPTLEPNAKQVCVALENARPRETAMVNCGVFLPKRFLNKLEKISGRYRQIRLPERLQRKPFSLVAAA